MTFAKVPRDFSLKMPRKQKRLARDSAVLAKLRSNSVIVVDALAFEQPKTKDFAAVLKNLKIDRSCLVALGQSDENIVKSARNVQKVDVMPVEELNAGSICAHQKMLFTKDALVAFLNRDAGEQN